MPCMSERLRTAADQQRDPAIPISAIDTHNTHISNLEKSE